MITTPAREQAPVTVRARLVSRPLLVRFLSVVGVSVSFYLMLSVVPLFARSAGASTNLAGLMTTALSLSTIAGYLPTPWLVARYGHRLVLAAGMLLLGAPTLVLTVSSNLTVLLAVCVVRGIWFRDHLCLRRRTHHLAHPARTAWRGTGPDRRDKRGAVGPVTTARRVAGGTRRVPPGLRDGGGRGPRAAGLAALAPSRTQRIGPQPDANAIRRDAGGLADPCAVPPVAHLLRHHDGGRRIRHVRAAGSVSADRRRRRAGAAHPARGVDRRTVARRTPG